MKLGMLEEQRQHVSLNTSANLQCEDMCKSAFMKIDTGITVMSTFLYFQISQVNFYDEYPH